MKVEVAAPPRWRGKLILAGLLLYLLLLLIQMPVAWLIVRLPADSPLQLAQADGTLWQGEVRQVAWQVEGERVGFGRLTWRWLPSALLKGRIGFSIELGDAAGKLSGDVLLDSKSVVLKNLRGRIDAVLLGLVSRPLGLLQPQGSLRVDIDDLYLTRKRIHGSVRLDWLGARSGMVVAPLGDYRAELKTDPDGRRARVDVSTLQGALNMIGNGDYLPGKAPHGSLSLTPPPGETGNLYRPLLDILGRPNASGTWVLLFNAG